MAAAAVVLGGVVASSSVAAIYTATYTGVITGDSFESDDITGLFGAAHTALGGQRYRAVFRIDDSLPNAVPFIGWFNQFVYGSYVQGGYNFGTTAMPVTGRITISGHTQGFSGPGASFAQQTDGNIYTTYHYVGGARASGAGQNTLTQSVYEPFEFLHSADFRAPLDYTLPVGQADSGGSFLIYQNDGAAYDWAYGSLRAERIVIAAGSGVPEPSQWALLIAGFGLAGTMLRRRAVALNKGII